MRDITANILAQKAQKLMPKKKHLFARGFLPTFIISLALAGLIGFSTAFATTTTWTGNGTTNGFCNTTSSNPNITGQNWLFILTQPDPGPWTLTATFDPATTPSPITASGVQQGGGSVHFTVNTSIGAKLLSASATNGSLGSNLVVSHCEVGRGTSTTATTLHDVNDGIVAVGSSVPLGTVMHDLATVTPSGATAPTGSVTFTFYTNDTCTGDGAAAGVVALNGATPGVAHPSNSTAALAPGDYAFKASWPGDTNYAGSTSTCENFTVNKAQLTVATNIHDAHHAVVTAVPLGSIVHDTASLTGAVGGFATPAITFTFYTNNICSGDGTAVANIGADEGDANLVRSAASAALGAGSYAYKGSVAGSDNYLGDDSDCEPLTVNQAQLSVNTSVHDASHADKTSGNVPLGSIMHDTATVTGGVDGFALPAVSFTLTSNYTHDCSQGVAVANNGTEGGATKSADSAALGAASYAYRASVASNANYIGSDSVCEPFRVDKAQLSVTTNIHNANHQIVTTVPTGSVVHDTASVSGAVAGFATPAVTFTFYTNNTCSGDGTSVANIGADEGNAALVRSANSAALTPGLYSYNGTVAGNENYLGDNSDCEPLTVTAGFWCSPGFWATALKQNRTGVLNYLFNNTNPHLNLTVVKYNTIGGAPLSKKAPAGDPTLAQVLANPNTYGGPAFNSVANYIAAQLGWGGTQATGDNCPLDAHGNLTTTTLAI